MHPAYRTGWRKPGFVAILFLLGVPLIATAQSRTAQVMVLKDPTPREPDLDKRFKSATPPAKPDASRLAAYNQQRLQLIGKASAHVSALAAALESSLAEHKEGTPFVHEIQFARALEELAGNIYSAMTTPTVRPAERVAGANVTDAGTASEAAQKHPELLAASRELVLESQGLQAEVGKSTADTLPVGVIIKSAKVREEARAIKERLQEP